ncbi:MAG: BNR repeat-containing protein [Lacibacter sp.]
MRTSIALLIFLTAQHLHAQQAKLVTVAEGWAQNSVNTAVFRKNSLVTFKDTQFIAFYNEQRYVVLGKRKTGSSKWIIKQTPYKGNTLDAHNVISIMVDGKGYLHMAWDHHNNPLNYCMGISPGSLDLTGKMSMTGLHEQRVTYPEFYKLANGNLLFFYRDGGSGNGNLIINRYVLKTKKWEQLQSNLLDGEGKRNAYWQAFVDVKGIIHISWVWRESPDVASNHDLCYARSTDGGSTWTTSTGKQYNLPITAATAEIACSIPQKSELINQTSMFADAEGRPFIATYWRELNDSIPQYHLVFKNGNNWNVQAIGFRKTPFSLSGTGSKRIPISRPQIISWQNGKVLAAAILFRDEEREQKVSAAVNYNIEKGQWIVFDLSQETAGTWEPTYDTELWKQKRILNLFVQRTEQVDGEGRSETPPQMIRVLEWKPGFKK